MGDNGTSTSDKPCGSATIVGPSAPESHVDRSKTDPRAIELGDVRSILIGVGKRMGTISPDGKTVPIEHEPGRDNLEVEKAALSKRDNQPLPSPSLPPDGEDQQHFGRQGFDFGSDTIEPPYDMATLCRLYENSGELRRNIDAMATNIDGFGHTFEGVLDFASPTANDEIRDILMLGKLEGVEDAASATPEDEDGDGDPSNDRIADLMDLTLEQVKLLEPTLEEVLETRELWERISTLELGRAKSFFEFVNPLESFIELRKRTRETREILGNAGWEVIREDPGDVGSKICQIYRVPFVNVRLLRADKDPTPVEVTVRKDAVHFETVEAEVFFRRYVRKVGPRKVYYKQFGDPRTVSRTTGRYFASVEALQGPESSQGEESGEGPKAQPANEFYHWTIESPVSSYGISRWIGELVAVLGNRAASEVNFLYFDNKAIPPMVLLVSGGRVSEQAVERLESYFAERVRGKENFWKILILEGLPADADVSEGDLEHGGKLRMELKPLIKEQLNDALFQEYDANNQIKIARSFRQPPIMTGDTRDMNRATAQIAMAVSEQQVYQPERDEFDAVMTRHFLMNLKIHFWRFKTRAPVTRLPNDLVKNVVASLSSGGITPNEARPLLADAFSTDKFPRRLEDWADVPPKLALAAARQGALPSAEPTAGEGEVTEGEVTEGEGATVDGTPGSEPTPTPKRKKPSLGLAVETLMRQAARDEVETLKDEFFDPSQWDDEDEEV